MAISPEEIAAFDPSCFEADGRPINDVLNDIEIYLRQSGLSEQVDHLEYLSNSGEYDRDAPRNAAGEALWPTKYRWVLCSAVKGGNEGYYVHIAAVGDKQDYRILGLAKMWKWEDAQAIAAAASTLFQKNQPYARYALIPATKPA